MTIFIQLNIKDVRLAFQSLLAATVTVPYLRQDRNHFCRGATDTPVLHLGHTGFSMDCNLPLDDHPSMY